MSQRNGRDPSVALANATHSARSGENLSNLFRGLKFTVSGAGSPFLFEQAETKACLAQSRKPPKFVSASKVSKQFQNIKLVDEPENRYPCANGVEGTEEEHLPPGYIDFNSLPEYDPNVPLEPGSTVVYTVEHKYRVDIGGFLRKFKDDPNISRQTFYEITHFCAVRNFLLTTEEILEMTAMCVRMVANDVAPPQANGQTASSIGKAADSVATATDKVSGFSDKVSELVESLTSAIRGVTDTAKGLLAVAASNKPLVLATIIAIILITIDFYYAAYGDNKLSRIICLVAGVMLSIMVGYRWAAEFNVMWSKVAQLKAYNDLALTDPTLDDVKVDELIMFASNIVNGNEFVYKGTLYQKTKDGAILKNGTMISQPSKIPGSALQEIKFAGYGQPELPLRTTDTYTFPPQTQIIEALEAYTCTAHLPMEVKQKLYPLLKGYTFTGHLTDLFTTPDYVLIISEFAELLDAEDADQVLQKVSARTKKIIADYEECHAKLGKHDECPCKDSLLAVILSRVVRSRTAIAHTRIVHSHVYPGIVTDLGMYDTLQPAYAPIYREFAEKLPPFRWLWATLTKTVCEEYTHTSLELTRQSEPLLSLFNPSSKMHHPFISGGNLYYLTDDPLANINKLIQPINPGPSYQHALASFLEPHTSGMVSEKNCPCSSIKQELFSTLCAEPHLDRVTDFHPPVEEMMVNKHFPAFNQVTPDALNKYCWTHTMGSPQECPCIDPDYARYFSDRRVKGGAGHTENCISNSGYLHRVADCVIGHLGEMLDVPKYAMDKILVMGVKWAALKQVGDLLQTLLRSIAFLFAGRTFVARPDLFDIFVYRASGFYSSNEKIKLMLQSCRERPSEQLFESTASALKDLETHLVRCITESWVDRARREIEKHRTELKILRDAFVQANASSRAFVVVFAGAHGVGKTEICETLAPHLARMVSRDPVFPASRVYWRGDGQYLEGLTSHHRVLGFKDFVGGADETSATMIDELCSAYDGAFKPNMAFQAKGSTYEIKSVIAATNFPYPTNIKGYQQNLIRYYRRRSLLWYVKPALDGQDPPAERVKHSILAQTPEENANFNHVKFLLLNPTPAEGIDITGVNSNRMDSVMTVAGHIPDEFRAIFDDYPNKQEFTYQEMVNITLRCCQAATRKAQQVRGNVAAFYSTDEFNALFNDRAPDAIEVEEDSAINYYLGILAGLTAGGLIGVLLYSLFEAYGDDASANYETRETTLKGKTQRKPPVFQTPVKANGPLAKSKDSQGWDALVERLQNNLVSVTNVRNAEIFGLLLNNTTLVTTLHHFAENGKLPEVFNYTITANVNGAKIQLRQVGDASNILRLGGPNGDVGVLRLASPIPGVRKINQFLLRNADISKIHERQPVYRYDGVLTHPGLAGDFIRSVFYEGFAANEFKTYGAFRYHGNGTFGDCGSPIIVDVGGQPRIIGIHVASRRADFGCYAGVIPHDTPVTQHSDFSQPDANSVFVDGTTLQTDKKPVLPLVFQNTDYTAVGLSTTGNPAVCRTQLKPTVFNGVHPDYPVRVAPSHKEPRMVKEQEVKHGVSRPLIPNALVEKAASIVNIKLALSSQAKKNMPKLYTWKEVANLMELDKATGFGYNGYSRKDFVELDTDGTWKFTDDYLAHLVAYESMYQSEDVTLPVIKPNLKDESLPLAKIAIGKVRTFEVAPLDHLLLGIRYCGPVFDAMHTEFLTKPSAVGFNILGHSYHKVMKRVLKFGKERIVALDYKAFESLVHWHYLRHFADYMQENNPLGPEAHRVRVNYLYSATNSSMIVDKLVYARYHGNPSGMVGTVDVNGYVNEIFQCCYFLSCFPEADARDYMDCYTNATYGDDVIAAASPKIADEFAFSKMAPWFHQYGMTITPATKDLNNPPEFCPSDNLEFCKTVVTYSAALHAYVPFVTTHTLFDRLAFSRDISDAGALQCASSALSFAFFHGNEKEALERDMSGELTYDEFRNILLSVLPPGSDAYLPTYRELEVRYEKTKHEGENKINYYSLDAYIDELWFEDTAHSNGNVQNQYNYADHGSTIKNDADATATNSASVAASKGDANANNAPGPAPYPKKKKHNPLAPLMLGLRMLTNLDESAEANSSEGLDIVMDEIPLPPPETETNENPYLVSPETDPENEVRHPVRRPIFRDADDVAQSNSNMTIANIPVTTALHVNPALDANRSAVFLTEEAATETKSERIVEVDETSFRYLLDISSYLRTVTLNYSSTPGTIIVIMQASPCQAIAPKSVTGKSSTAYNLSPLEFLTHNHRFWRGSLVFTFELIAPKEISLSVMAVFIPGSYSGAAPSLAEASTAPHYSFQFTETARTFSFKTDMISPQTWMQPTLAVNNGTAYGVQTSYGLVYLYQVSKINGNVAAYTTPPEINIYIRGGEDFELNTWQTLPYFTVVAPVAQLDTVFKNETVQANANSVEGAITTAQPVDVRTTDVNKTAGNWNLLRVVTVATSAAPLTPLASFAHPADTLTPIAKRVIGNSIFYRGKLRLRFKPMASGVGGGQAIIYFMPYENPSGVAISLQRASQMRHVKLDFSSNEPTIFEVPMMSQERMMYTGMKSLGNVYLTVMNKYQAPTTGNASTIDISIEASWDIEPLIPKPVIASLDMFADYEHVADANSSETTVTKPLDREEMSKTSASGVIGARRKVTIDSKNLMSYLYRPVNLGSITFSIFNAKYTSFNLPQLYPSTAFNAGAGYRGLHGLLRNAYIFRSGGVYYDLSWRATKQDAVNVSITAFCSSPGYTADFSKTGNTSSLPSNLTGYLPTSQKNADQRNKALGLATSTFGSRGNVRIYVPYKSQFSVANSALGTTVVEDQMETVVEVYRTTDDVVAGDTFNMEVFASNAASCTLEGFVGLPPYYLDCLVLVNGATKTYHDYPGYWTTPGAV